MPDINIFLENRNKDKCWIDFRYKKLNDEYMYFRFPHYLADIVDESEFQRIEEKRIPIFIGLTADKYLPNIQDHFKSLEQGVLVAILYQYMTTTFKTGIQIGLYKNNKFSEISYLEA